VVKMSRSCASGSVSQHDRMGEEFLLIVLHHACAAERDELAELSAC
jgi:hypothetical protein